MNYRHAFHAGNFADVVKHLILVRILEYLKRKETPFRVLDTHAGIGLYDLQGDEAGRTGEWVDGIGRLVAEGLAGEAGNLAATYLRAVRAQNSDGTLRFYPGSPLLTRQLLREQDRLFALELHPQDAEALSENFAGDIQTRVTHLDGWAAMGTHLPPKEKRGLVLVDPPFEEKGEFARMAAALVKAHCRWPTGIYAFWYPIKEPRDVEAYMADLRTSNIGKILRLELTIRAPSAPPRLHGTGMIVVNPPFALEGEMQVLLPALAERLAEEGRGGYRIEWVAGE
ncbi:23S rRNA (adenine(2030)-N(6))-methyltransferase RlmJ [Devosia sp. RR2S18]|uniref:23S rRNA (adenine(2030)-N(6))-methyltransferase RlmJ n=1 Tax=Devosia rhizosphaerae TaxID=3049774 RepID=UPI002541EDA3|nr:23S rRNA (adenine(2030)-N(6))-methyltransferase RlmJ [Devosia sp. RR2S18]WIJ25437.1 23S rRNA (adenine(2030)-N(6))-methyltransferase RlmJ [Devosia sp. RR2S18]